jgi:hypothetical protein
MDDSQTRLHTIIRFELLLRIFNIKGIESYADYGIKYHLVPRPSAFGSMLGTKHGTARHGETIDKQNKSLESTID